MACNWLTMRSSTEAWVWLGLVTALTTLTTFGRVGVRVWSPIKRQKINRRQTLNRARLSLRTPVATPVTLVSKIQELTSSNNPFLELERCLQHLQMSTLHANRDSSSNTDMQVLRTEDACVDVGTSAQKKFQLYKYNIIWNFKTVAEVLFLMKRKQSLLRQKNFNW